MDPSPMVGLKAGWTVDAGLIPGQAMPEYRRTWLYTSDHYTADVDRPGAPDSLSIFETLRGEAFDYAGQITDPSRVNWVRIDFVWF